MSRLKLIARRLPDLATEITSLIPTSSLSGIAKLGVLLASNVVEEGGRGGSFLAKATETADGLLKKYGEDYGAMVGALQSTMGS